MTFQSSLAPMTPLQRRDYGYARVRDIAFDAVTGLWRRRQSQGMTQADLARTLDCDPAWVSRNLRGPGNWTLRTVGAFVEALDGEIEMRVYGLDEPLGTPANYHAYADYVPALTAGSAVSRPLFAAPHPTRGAARATIVKLDQSA